MVRIFKLKKINIYSDSDNHYIVHNTNKPFEDGHTHINNFNTAKYLAYLIAYKRMPKNNHLSFYLIDSLIRLSDDNKYINKLKDLKNKEIKNKEKHK